MWEQSSAHFALLVTDIPAPSRCGTLGRQVPRSPRARNSRSRCHSPCRYLSRSEIDQNSPSLKISLETKHVPARIVQAWYAGLTGGALTPELVCPETTVVVSSATMWKHVYLAAAVVVIVAETLSPAIPAAELCWRLFAILSKFNVGYTSRCERLSWTLRDIREN